MPDYSNDTYLRSLDQSSADIRRQVENSIGEITKQREVAGQQTAQIPGAAASIFGAGSKSVSDDMASISRIDKHGNQANLPLQSLMDAFSAGTASYGRATGLLNQGFDEQAQQRRSGVESILAQLLADTNAKRNTYVGGREAEDRDRAFQEDESRRRADLERELQDRDAALRRELLELERSNQTNYLLPPTPSILPPPNNPWSSPGGWRR